MATTEADLEGRAGIFPPVPALLAAAIGAAVGLWCAGMVCLSLAVPLIP